ncbi:MAG: type VI secretion system Vgr family protein [Bacteroidales bacterium]
MLKKKKTVWSTNPTEILKELLGSEISIKLSENSVVISEFKGVIKRVNIKGKDADQGMVTAYGGSPTLLMTDDYTMNSFIDMDIASIVQQTLSDIGLNIEHKLNPMDTGDIPFVYRYKESSYDFLRRLISSCGESFWYDGTKIIIGAPSKEDDADIAINCKNDMLEIDISSGLGNFQIEQYDYDHTRDQLGQWISPFDESNLDHYSAQAYKKSKEILKDWTVMPGNLANRSISTSRMAREGVVGEYFSKLSGESYITGKTTTCRVAIGRVLKMETDSKIDNSKIKEMGRFRVVEVIHTYNNNSGSYHNEFKAFNAKTDHLPFYDILYPTAFPEVAKVVDNADPKNMGRVKVKYMWQQLDDHPQGKTSGWMRVQTSDAGSSDIVEKNRGLFFVPEIGDQVMVGYEYGDPNRPFVMGSLFHSNNSKGIESDNTIKTIRTKSGHTLEFNDDEGGSWGITIQDREGNIMRFDTKGKNIEITAPETMTLYAKNILINADENVEIGAKRDVTIAAESNIDVVAKDDLTQLADGDLSVSAKGNIDINATSDVTIAGQNTSVDAKTKSVINGAQTLVSGKKATVQGAAHKVEIM